MPSQFAVNARFVTQELTGIQRYCHEVGQRLVNGALVSPGPALPEYEDLNARLHVTGGILRGHPWEQVILPRALSRGVPLLSPAGCGPVSYANQVVVVHDVAVLEHPQWYSRGYAALYRHLWPVLLRRAKRVVTVSEFCRRRLLEFFALPEQKVEVGYEAASARFSRRCDSEVAEGLKMVSIDKPYFLAIAAVSARKNLDRLFSAWAHARSYLGDCVLALVGKQNLRFSRESILKETPSGVRFLGAVSDEMLARLYSGARGLLYPSLYEGFGLPILEAMSCGCPVLTSTVSAMPEIAGDAALLVDPLSEQSLAAGIVELLNSSVSTRLRSLGLKRHSGFSWARTASVLESALLN